VDASVDPDGERELYLINLGWQVKLEEYFQQDPPWCYALEIIYPYPYPTLPLPLPPPPPLPPPYPYP
jgi:hypothetical protein